jgi:hypothetical protein
MWIYVDSYNCLNMAYCSNCGTEIGEGAAFCSECGEAVGTESEPETPTDTTTPNPSAESTGVSEEDQGIQWARVGMAVGFALIPAFIAYIGLSLASGGDPVGIVFFLALPVFGYLLYQRPTAKAMTGGMCYYLAIEFLLSPFVFLLYTFAFASENTATTAGQAGAAIGGFALTIGAFVIGLPLAIALYLVSRRLDPARDN